MNLQTSRFEPSDRTRLDHRGCQIDEKLLFQWNIAGLMALGLRYEVSKEFLVINMQTKPFIFHIDDSLPFVITELR